MLNGILYWNGQTDWNTHINHQTIFWSYLEYQVNGMVNIYIVVIIKYHGLYHQPVSPSTNVTVSPALSVIFTSSHIFYNNISATNNISSTILFSYHHFSNSIFSLNCSPHVASRGKWGNRDVLIQGHIWQTALIWGLWICTDVNTHPYTHLHTQAYNAATVKME